MVFLHSDGSSLPPRYEVTSSTSSRRLTDAQRQALLKMRRKIMAPARKVKRVLKKVNKPTATIEDPHSAVMPTHPPDMPQRPQSQEPPKTGVERFFAAAAKVMLASWNDNIFVWLPAISTDPNAGPTYGILPVMVLSDAQKHIRHLVAPSYTYNSLFGQTGTMRYYFYPTVRSQLFVTGSYSQHTNRELKVRYENSSAFDGALYLRGEAYHTVDGSRRFFGIGPQTHEGDEAGFTSKETYVRAAAGVNFKKNWRTTFGFRFQRYSVDHNIVPNVSDFLARYPNILGAQGLKNTAIFEYRLLWDTRDFPVTPSQGSSGELYVEKTSKNAWSNSDFLRYGLEGKHFFPWNDPKHLTVVHGLYEWVNGPLIPFHQLSSVGGRETLRGYGEGRFADRGRLVFNVEHRIIMVSMVLMGIQTNFEIAPFVDFGAVFPTLPDIQRKNILPVYGAAFRAAVKPNVVGSVDVGVGKEGPGVFVSINYPF